MAAQGAPRGPLGLGRRGPTAGLPLSGSFQLRGKAQSFVSPRSPSCTPQRI
eukprot:NODE_10747_length_430_cov_3.160105_g9633_i0.p5 GENE.NODE_10747_length_430_cov_3.160105_g9633_i0~~NODE_10747_length_430_cov_3.160105_g9633_i0.p5  ORF type:complete len:60 (-),score=4.99 NODE_10747_length_430_cov_3.160105_g9633_i0:249-401(-)